MDVLTLADSQEGRCARLELQPMRSDQAELLHLHEEPICCMLELP